MFYSFALLKQLFISTLRLFKTNLHGEALRREQNWLSVLRGYLNVAAQGWTESERPRDLEAEEGSVRLGRACKLTKTFIRERLNDMMTLQPPQSHTATSMEQDNGLCGGGGRMSV